MTTSLSTDLAPIPAPADACYRCGGGLHTYARPHYDAPCYAVYARPERPEQAAKAALYSLVGDAIGARPHSADTAGQRAWDSAAAVLFQQYAEAGAAMAELYRMT